MTFVKRAAVVVVAVLSAVIVGAIGLAYMLVGADGVGINRLHGAFDSLDESARPAAISSADGSDPLVFLLVGLDSYEDDQVTGTDGVEPWIVSRADAIMMVRVGGTDGAMSAVSIPRDSWVDIPGHGFGKINASYAIGGPALLIQTVEQITDVRVDHFAVVDFHGFIAVTDALGGVEIDVDIASSNRGFDFEVGPQFMRGEKALAYVQQRHGLPNGDFDRVKRQQQYVTSVLEAISERGVLSSPGETVQLIRALTAAVSVDERLGMPQLLALASTLRGLDREAVSLETLPARGLGMEGQQSVVYLDDAAAATVWREFRDGD